MQGNRRWMHFILLVVLIFFLGKIAYAKNNIDGQFDQQAAERFSEKSGYKQWSVFLGKAIKSNEAESIWKYIANEMLNQGVESDEMIFTYSSTTTALTQTDLRQFQAEVFVTGGNFGFFHSEKLIDGWWYQDDDLMFDRIVLDEKTAWELYGSTEVAGLPIMINGKDCIVSGVIEGVDGRIYSSSKNNLFKDADINCMEFVIPEIVGGLSEGLISGAFNIYSDEFEYVCNSERFEIRNLYKKFRVLIDDGDVYEFPVPFWERKAQCTENRLILIMIFCFFDIFLLLCLVILEAQMVKNTKFFKRLFLKR